MQLPGHKKESLKKMGSVTRRAVTISQEQLVRSDYLQPDAFLPLVIRPALDGVKLDVWAADNRELIEAQLNKHGAILFRGFKSREAEDFERFIKSLAGDLLEYADQSSPRHKVRGNLYTSTDYPADQHIFLHNENSYSHAWPMKLFFFCVTPAEQGGETPICDVRRVLNHIDQEIKERFIEKGWMLTRNFGNSIGLPWQSVFQTSQKAAVQQYCKDAGIEMEWVKSNHLRTRQVRRAIIKHPRTGESVWFNHATFFHITTLEPNTRKALLEQFVEEDLPYNSYYGDGTPLESYVLEMLREAYRKETILFPWHKGDILMLDNMLTAHGRTPFVGVRKILVGMSESFRANDISGK